MLTQSEADSLIEMEKTFVSPITISIPPGTDETYDLTGEDKREAFLLDLWRGTIRLSKYKLQSRGRKIVVLVRLDIGGAPHTNPDGSKIGGTHIHLYKEGFEDKWAYPVPTHDFRDTSNIRISFEDFCRYCHIINAPAFQEVLV